MSLVRIVLYVRNLTHTTFTSRLWTPRTRSLATAFLFPLLFLLPLILFFIAERREASMMKHTKRRLFLSFFLLPFFRASLCFLRQPLHDVAPRYDFMVSWCGTRRIAKKKIKKERENNLDCGNNDLHAGRPGSILP